MLRAIHPLSNAMIPIVCLADLPLSRSVFIPVGRLWTNLVNRNNLSLPIDCFGFETKTCNTTCPSCPSLATSGSFEAMAVKLACQLLGVRSYKGLAVKIRPSTTAGWREFRVPFLPATDPHHSVQRARKHQGNFHVESEFLAENGQPSPDFAGYTIPPTSARPPVLARSLHGAVVGAAATFVGRDEYQ